MVISIGPHDPENHWILVQCISVDVLSDDYSRYNKRRKKLILALPSN
jgi:hypothetical protein